MTDKKQISPVLMEVIKGLNQEKAILAEALTYLHQNDAIDVDSRLRTIDAEIRKYLNP